MFGSRLQAAKAIIASLFHKIVAALTNRGDWFKIKTKENTDMEKRLLCFLLILSLVWPLAVPAAADSDPASPEPPADEVFSEEPEEPDAPALDGDYRDQERAIAAAILDDSMSDVEKLFVITQYAADHFNYGSYGSSGTAEPLFLYGAGNCYANSYFIIDLCKLEGINAWLRSAGRDKNASSTHVDVCAYIDGMYYTAGAGSSGTKPRYFSVCELPGAFSVEGGVIYQYDGFGVEDLVVPSRSEDAVYRYRSYSKTFASQTITQIGYAGEECFSYGGSGLRSITLPATVKTVTGTAFKGCMDLENIYVDAANPYFTSINGVLYSKDLTRLVCVPAKKTSVTLPESVTTRDADAFYGGSIPVYVAALPFEDVGDEWYADSVRFVYENGLFMGTSDNTFSPNNRMTRGMFITVLGRFAGKGTWSALGSWSGRLGISGASQVAVRDRTTTSGSSVLARIASVGEPVQVLSAVPAGEDGAPWYEVRYGGTQGYVREKSTSASGTVLLHVYQGAFTDLPDGQYYTGYAQWASTFGVMYGVTDTTFCPDQNIRRQDICVLLYRYLTGYLNRTLPTDGSAFTDDADISDYARDAVYAMRRIGVISGYPDGSFRPGSYATRAEVAVMFQRLSDYLS